MEEDPLGGLGGVPPPTKELQLSSTETLRSFLANCGKMGVHLQTSVVNHLSYDSSRGALRQEKIPNRAYCLLGDNLLVYRSRNSDPNWDRGKSRRCP